MQLVLLVCVMFMFLSVSSSDMVMNNLGDEDKADNGESAGDSRQESNLRLPAMNKKMYNHLEDQYCLYGW